MEVWKTKDGSEVAVYAATWELNHKVTFGSLAKEFESNPTKAWRNYGSIVSTAIEAAIKDPTAVFRSINPRRADPWDYARGKFHEWFRGKPGIQYFLHYDLSVRRDACGKGLSHREANGQLVVDWMHQTIIPEGRNINFAAERQYLYDLQERGFQIPLVTYDQFQSEETRQILEEKGFATDRESADRGTQAYDTLIEPLLTTANQAAAGDWGTFTPALDVYNHPVFIKEMKNLKLINGIKYDHPKKNPDGTTGSKDVADGVACSITSCLKWHGENKSSGPPVIRIHRAGGNVIRQDFGDHGRYE